MGFGIAAIVFWISVIFLYALKRFGKKHEDLLRRFVAEEREANTARKRPIEPALLYQPDLSALPFRSDASPELAEAQQKVLLCAAQEMIRFPQKTTNTTLKNTYGAANLKTIIQYEENFFTYLTALIHWAEALLTSPEHPLREEGVGILETAAAAGSEYRKNYTLLADYYAQRQDRQALQALLTALETAFFTDDRVKQNIITYIKHKCDEGVPL